MAIIFFISRLPVVPHKTVAEVSNIETNQKGGWVIVMHEWQSEPIDGSKDGWGSEALSLARSPSISLSLSVSVHLEVSCSEVVVSTGVVVVLL